LLSLLACLSPCSGQGQSLDEILTEFQLDDEESVLSAEDLLTLEQFVREPLNLNSVSRKQLEKIPLLPSSDISLILKKRNELGQFISIFEILQFQELDPVTRQLLPLTTTVEEVRPLGVVLRNRWTTSTEDIRMVTRVDFQRASASGGFVLERDPGEPTLTDFASAHLSIPVNSHTRAIVGDFQLHSGYGLLFGRSSRPFKGNTSITYFSRPGRGLRPWRSTLEQWALRGAAVEYEYKSNTWIASLSSSPMDAILDSLSVTSISVSGLHQSETARDRKHNLNEESAILAWKRSGEQAQVGILTAVDRWQIDGNSPTNRPPQSYGSVHGQYTFDKLSFFGETAVYNGTSPSYLTGATLDMKTLRWMGSVRYYPGGFRGPRSRPLGEWSRDQLNESGIYQALSISTGKIRLFSYGDWYRETVAVSEGGQPVRGFETAATLSFRWRYGGNALLRWKREDKSGEDGIAYAGEIFQPNSSRETWRASSTLPVNKQLKWQFQGDRVVAQDDDGQHTGHGLSTKMHLATKSWRISFNWVMYRSDDWASRIYVWDLNLPGEMRNRAFASSGQSLATFVRIKTAHGATVSWRVRTTWERFDDPGRWSIPNVESGFQMDIAF